MQITSPIKLITNMWTDEHPSELFNLLIDAWRVKTIGAGEITASINKNLFHGYKGEFEEFKIEINLEQLGQPKQFIGSTTITTDEANHFKKGYGMKLIHNPASRIEKVEWIGFRSTCEEIPIFMVVFNFNFEKFKFMLWDLEEIYHVKLIGNNSTIKSFPCSHPDPNTMQIQKGTFVSIDEKGWVVPFDSSEKAIGVLEHDIHGGEIVEARINESLGAMSFRAAKKRTEKEWLLDKQPSIKRNPIYTNAPIKKEKKTILIGSLDSIRDKLTRREI